MRVDPALQQHPKYILLRQKIGPRALEVLHLLWAHCEANKRGEWWPMASQSYVEQVCGWNRPFGALFSALLEYRWIHQEEGGIRVHDWEKTNWRAVTNWELGSRPKRKVASTEKPRLPRGSSQGYSPMNEGMSEGMSECGSLSELCPEVKVPGLEEALAWAEVNGVDPEWARKKWEDTDGTNGWERHGRLIKWQQLWKTWFLRDAESGKFRKMGAKKRERWQVEQELNAVKLEMENHPYLVRGGKCDRAETEVWNRLVARKQALKEELKS